MTIDVFIITYNDKLLMPYILRHYKQFARNITFYDNMSDDGCVEMALEAGCRVIQYDTGGKIEEANYLHWKNNCWKQSDADWVIVHDADEFVYHPNIINFLSNTNATVIHPRGYEMMSEEIPVGDGQIYDEIQMGYPCDEFKSYNVYPNWKSNYSKGCVFKPSQISEINFGPGCHECKPVGNVNEDWSKEIKLLHYKYLSRDLLIKKYDLYRERQSEHMKSMGWGNYREWFADEINRQFDEWEPFLKNVITGQDKKKLPKVSIAIAAYFGRRDGVPSTYLNDYLHFIKIHNEVLKKYQNQLHKIYYVCTYEESSVNLDYINSFFYNLLESNPKVVVLNRQNLGGSYAGWHNVLEFDNDESDFIIFCEDDYAIEDNAIERMLEYYTETPDMIYLCQLWNRDRYTKDGVDILEHAQISNGMINNHLYNNLKKERGLDFVLYLEPGKISIYNNQASFLENYRKNGILIRDMKEKYSCVFNNDNSSVINFCNPNGADIFKPITNWYPEHCPNLRYNW